MQPYWVCFDRTTPEVVGGVRDGGGILQNVDAAYPTQPVELQPLEPRPLPSAEDLVGAPRKWVRPWGHHQIGGLPWSVGYGELACCRCGAAMTFAGIVGSEDENVLLTEDGGSPVCLIIGDCDHLNVFTCRGCRVVGARWVC